MYETLTVARDACALFAGYYREPRPVDEVIELVGLQEKRDDARAAGSRAASGAGSTSGSRSSATRS